MRDVRNSVPSGTANYLKQRLLIGCLQCARCAAKQRRVTARGFQSFLKSWKETSDKNRRCFLCLQKKAEGNSRIGGTAMTGVRRRCGFQKQQVQITRVRTNYYNTKFLGYVYIYDILLCYDSASKLFLLPFLFASKHAW